MEERNEMEPQGPAGLIVATEEPATDALIDLDRRLRDLETAVGELRTVKASSSGRKTAPAETSSFTAKAVDAAEAASVDDALRSLSVEQRIAVKSGLMRAGLLA